MTNVPDAFKVFYDRIQLTETQTARIDSAWATLVRRLIEHYELEDGNVFLQGSYPNGTAIRPDPERNDGEYDVDLVSVSARNDASAQEAIKELYDALDELGYGDKFERDPLRPCVRLRYADDAGGDKFHVDVIPARASSEAPLEVPRPAEERWHPTAPLEYTEWCQNQGEAFARTVQMLKRWRDHNQGAREAIKSIVLQVLVSSCLDTSSAQDGDRIAGTLKALKSFLDGQPTVPVIENPVLPDENLAERWTPAEYSAFKDQLAEACEIADEAIGALSDAASCEAWRRLFGKDFPESKEGGKRFPIAPVPAPGIRQAPQEAPQRDEWA